MHIKKFPNRCSHLVKQPKFRRRVRFNSEIAGDVCSVTASIKVQNTPKIRIRIMHRSYFNKELGNVKYRKIWNIRSEFYNISKGIFCVNFGGGVYLF